MPDVEFHWCSVSDVQSIFTAADLIAAQPELYSSSVVSAWLIALLCTSGDYPAHLFISLFSQENQLSITPEYFVCDAISARLVVYFVLIFWLLNWDR